MEWGFLDEPCSPQPDYVGAVLQQFTLVSIGV